MSLVASRVSLTHRCTIQRNNATVDDWGGDGTPDWDDSATDVPCRAWVQGDREPVDKDRTVVVEDLRMVVAIGTDVSEQDRISDVTERGVMIFPGPLGVEGVMRHKDHVELLLVRIK